MQTTKVVVKIRNHLNRRERNNVELYIRELLQKPPFEYIVDDVSAFMVFETIDMEK